MKFTKLDLPGVYLIEREDSRDERGFFGRTFCRRELADHGLEFEVTQAGLAHNVRKGTLRGMHFQKPPHAETKLVTCVKGAIFDCVIDIRRESASYLKSLTVVLPEFGPALYVPEGFAHGYQTLEDDTMVQYQMSACHAPEAADGLRWDDPELDIRWPDCGHRTISARDLSWPLLSSL